MLFFSSLVTTVVIVLAFSAASESFQDSYYGKKDSHQAYNSLATLIKSKNMSEYNIASDKDERTLLLPKIKHIGVPKKRTIKKAPRRTIQKIIKKTKKNRKSYNQMTQLPTEPTRNNYYEIRETTSTTQATQKKKIRKWNSKYARYPMPFHKLAARKDFTMHRRNKRDVDRNSPFQNIAARKFLAIHRKKKRAARKDWIMHRINKRDVVKDLNMLRRNKREARKDLTTHLRNKRETDRDLYILEDLDEMEFLSDENDVNIVKTHVKKYW